VKLNFLQIRYQQKKAASFLNISTTTRVDYFLFLCRRVSVAAQSEFNTLLRTPSKNWDDRGHWGSREFFLVSIDLTPLRLAFIGFIIFFWFWNPQPPKFWVTHFGHPMGILWLPILVTVTWRGCPISDQIVSHFGHS